MHGFSFLSAGRAWEKAYGAALAFLENEKDGIVLLGPGIGEGGKEWLQDHSLLANPLRLGARVQDWKEWVKGRARANALNEGLPFRVMNRASQREFFRFVLGTLTDSGAFHHLQSLWKEERFFAGLLDCVEEARMAGLLEEAALDRAVHLLTTGKDAVTREVYSDFWALLKSYESGLSVQGGTYDYPALVRKATAPAIEPRAYFLLGFDHLPLLEADLVQVMASESRVVVPVALTQEELKRAVKEKDSDILPARMVSALVRGYAGKIEVAGDAEPTSVSPAHFLEAHAPSEEIRAAAAFGRQMLEGGREVRYVLPRDFQEESVFCEELGLPKHFRAKSALAHPVARLFFHALELKEKDYELTHGLEFAQLIQFTLGKFSDLPSRAVRAGIRRGLSEWQRKAKGDTQLEEFTEFLAKVDALLPSRAPSAAYAEAVVALAELIGIGELARRAHDRIIEREAHASIAALIRNAQMLAVSIKEPLEFQAWMRELSQLLSGSLAGEPVSFFPHLQFYSYGEWLPPSGENTVTVASGWDSSVSPARNFCFFLEEGARRKLADLQLVSQVQEEMTLLQHMKRLAAGGTTIFSWSRHDGAGKELEPSWMASVLAVVPGKWPEVARNIKADANGHAVPEVRTQPPEVKLFSPSLLELYKECPFRAFALKVLRLEDKMQAASLDVSHLDLGQIVHRALYLFYTEKKGKDLAEPGPVVEACLAQALAEQKIEYYKGNESLLEVQLGRLKKLLTDFIALDQENYRRFPYFRDPDAEKRVGGGIGPYRWEGTADRIDVDEENKKLLVIDYKSGATTPSSGDVAKLRRFQLQLYMDAAESLYPGFEAAGGLYVSLKTGDRKQGLVRKEFNQAGKEPEAGAVKYYQFHSRTGALKSDEEFARIREETRAEALRIAENIQSGIFDVTPLEEDICKRCEVRPACRIREIQAPPRQAWKRLLPDFSYLLRPPQAADEKKASAKGFNQEQQEALERKGFVFVEASAGTGKTTVIVEKIRRYLAERLASGDLAHQAVEKFAAISFTDKSAQELKTRVSQSLVQDDTMGPRLAAQAIRQISTIHGFCRRVLSDFPVEAGVSPMAALLDQRESEILLQQALEEFFLHPPEGTAPLLETLFASFSRAKIEGFLRTFLSQRLLLEEDLRLYGKFFSGDLEKPGGLVAPGEEKSALQAVLDLGELFSRHYEELKREREVLDFNDLEALSLKVLEKSETREYYRSRFGLLLVDEFQDTNSVQRKILERIAQPGWKNLFVVGDAKQSIYRFRAADVSVFQGLRREAEASGNLVTLFRNYRSRKELVEAANLVTESIFPGPGEPAPPFEAVAARAEAFHGEGGQVCLVEVGDPEIKSTASERRAEEARALVAEIQKQIAKGRAPGEIAVLMRKVSGNEAYLQALTQAGLPFRVGSSKGFYSQSVILDGIALLRALYGASNDMALLAVLRSPWIRMKEGKILAMQRRGAPRDPLWNSMQAEDAPMLFEWKKRSTFLSFSEILEEAYRVYPLDRREHLQTVKFLSVLRAMENETMPRAEILDRLSQWSGWEKEEDAQDDATMPEPGAGGAIQVMTVHSAKGLEFPVTILPDLASPLQPDRSALRIVPGVGIALKLEEAEKPAAYSEVGEKNKERELAESKRLLYVAITRAQEECILILPRRGEEKKEKKRETWEEMLRSSGLGPTGGGRELVARKPVDAEVSRSFTPKAPLALPFRMETSISELAALQFCGEFHRRKFVQGWDDQVVSLWPTPEVSFRKNREKISSPERARALELLKRLGLQSKERGIALHRVLERVESDLAHGRLWLQEAYGAQGADPDSELLAELIELDLAVLSRFLGSDLGRQLFSPEVNAFPELPFLWKLGAVSLHGAIDRVIRDKDGTWVVVDYKSSILEESRERYRFQVASYMAAIHAFACGQGEKNPVVRGFLVDLYEATAHPVEKSLEEAALFLSKEIQRLEGNYTLTDNSLDLFTRGIQAGDHCFSCPYSLHCDLGAKFVLAFK